MEFQPGDRRIVVGTHGSAPSLAGLRWAAGEASLRRIPLLAVYAWEDASRSRAPYASPGWLAPGWPRRSPEDRKSAADWLRDEVLALGVRAETLVEVADGLPARVLLDRAAGAELLVLGSASGASPDGLGPVARACLRHAACPVVLVSPEKAGQHPAAPGHGEHSLALAAGAR